MAEALGLGVLIWSPLAGGYLAGPPPRRSKLPPGRAGLAPSALRQLGDHGGAGDRRLHRPPPG